MQMWSDRAPSVPGCTQQSCSYESRLIARAHGRCRIGSDSSRARRIQQVPAVSVESAFPRFLAKLAACAFVRLKLKRAAVIGIVGVLGLVASAESVSAIWDLTETNCASGGCHGPTPGTTNPAVLNGANAVSVINHANNHGMGGTQNGGAALTSPQLTALASYIAGFASDSTVYPVPFRGTTPGASTSIPVPKIYFNTAYGALTNLELVSSTNGGSVGFALPSGGPPGVNGTANYTPAQCQAAGIDTVTYRATGPGPPAVTSSNRTFQVRIADAPAPAVNSNTAPTGTTELAFTYQISVNPASCPLLVTSYTASGLPSWLTLDASTGRITGTPPLSAARPTPYDFSVTASIGSATSLSYPVHLTISIGTPAITSPANAPNGRVANPYSGYTVTATNAPTSFSVAPGVAPNVMPPGLNLDTATGQVTGTPTALGTFTPTIRATNSGGLSGSSVITFSIESAVPPDVSSTPATASGQTGIDFNYQIVGTNNPSSYSASGLPPGLNQPTATGLINGKPTTVGVFSATVTATNGAGSGSRAVTITIALGPPVITTPAAATGGTGLSFSYQILATNNPSTFNATGLPPGVVVNTTTGLISGIPTAIGVYNATVSAANATATTTLPIRITINSGSPDITSPASASGFVGQSFVYQITAANNPTSFAATGLPPGLSANTSSGQISGTPTVAGTSKVTVSATNAAGTSSLEVTITIGILAPTVQDLNVEAQAGAATTIKLPVSGQFTQVALVAPPSHGTVVNPPPNSATVVYTANRSYAGPDTFTYNATGPGGTSQTAQVSITVPEHAPVTEPVALTVSLNTATTVDLSAFISGTGISGVAIVVDAAHGITQVNGTRVTYTPKQNFFGSDSFKYQAFGTLGASVPALVTVTVTGRPDPSQDANVSGLVNAQSQVARRFARAQISNYQRRMETLHVDPANSDAAPATVSPRKVADATGSGPDSVVGTPPYAPGFVRTSTEPVNPGPAVGASTGVVPAGLVNSVLSLAQSGTINLANSTERTDTSSGPLSGFGLWAGGNISFGTRGGSEIVAPSRFTTDGITVGGDWRVNRELVLGMGVGYATDRTRFGDDGTKLKSDGTSVAVYGSFQPSRNTFIDALLGYGTLNFDSDRFVASLDQFAFANRDGHQIFGSVAAGFEYRNNWLLFSPYGRFDFTYDKFKQATENGAGLNALTYLDQSQHTLQGSLGLRAESQHDTSYGVIRPRARIEYRHDFEGGGNAGITYADQFAGLSYSVAPVGTKRNFLLLGAGTDFIFRGGLKLGVDYQWQSSGGADSGQAIRLLVSQELDGKGWPYVPWTSRPLTYGTNVDGGFTYDDNVTRGRDSDEILHDKIYSINARTSRTFNINDNTRAVVTGLLNGEAFHTYTGLAHVSGGLQAEVQYRGSADFNAVTYAAFARGFLDGYNSHLRDGGRWGVGLSARSSVTDRIDLYGELSANWRRANSDVWNLTDYVARLNVDYSLGRVGTFYFAGEYHRGDTVADGKKSLVNLSIAEVFVRDDAFPGKDLFAYRFDGRTWVGTVGLNFPLGQRDSIDFSYRRVTTNPVSRPSFDTGSLRYFDNQYTVLYLIRF